MSDLTDIQATLDAYAAAYCAKDLDRLMAIFVDGDAISLIGTGADELCSGREQVAAVFARNFRDATTHGFDWGWTDISIHGDAATVAVALTLSLTAGDKDMTVPLRWTVSLVRVGGAWKWVHRHASVAAGGQEKGTAYPTAK
ncbi:nuclear transport factor 2 family protein [Shimia biformata]|uniref:nuclear transport factor 2 family protein n=1 Tax=Shimia biformata TaxID=1294299 RepID=UPI00194EAACC|nr:nuclear transport factor 2 family protein [Shimia biformata]